MLSVNGADRRNSVANNAEIAAGRSYDSIVSKNGRERG